MHSRDLPEALKRIAAELAAQTGSLDLSRLQLTYLPAELQDLKSLQNLNCSDTQVSDLEPLRRCSNLQNLKETLENPSHPRENAPVIAGADLVHGQQAARIWRLRTGHG